METARGRCDRALDLAYQCLRLAQDSELSPGPAWCAVAFAEAAGGSLDRGLAAAERGVGHSEDDGDLLFLPTTLHALGHIRLLRGDPAGAVDALRRVRRLESAQGLAEPGLRRWHAELAEALAGIGAVTEAEELIEETRRDASRLGRPSVLATLDRAAALVTAACGDLKGAVRGMERAVSAQTALTRSYRKLGVRSRVGLTRVITNPRAEDRSA